MIQSLHDVQRLFELTFPEPSPPKKIIAVGGAYQLVVSVGWASLTGSFAGSTFDVLGTCDDGALSTGSGFTRVPPDSVLGDATLNVSGWVDIAPVTSGGALLIYKTLPKWLHFETGPVAELNGWLHASACWR